MFACKVLSLVSRVYSSLWRSVIVARRLILPIRSVLTASIRVDNVLSAATLAVYSASTLRFTLVSPWFSIPVVAYYASSLWSILSDSSLVYLSFSSVC